MTFCKRNKIKEHKNGKILINQTFIHKMVAHESVEPYGILHRGKIENGNKNGFTLNHNERYFTSNHESLKPCFRRVYLDWSTLLLVLLNQLVLPDAIYLPFKIPNFSYISLLCFQPTGMLFFLLPKSPFRVFDLASLHFLISLIFF